MIEIKKNIWGLLFLLFMWSGIGLLHIYIEKQIEILGKIAIVLCALAVVFVILAAYKERKNK